MKWLAQREPFITSKNLTASHKVLQENEIRINFQSNQWVLIFRVYRGDNFNETNQRNGLRIMKKKIAVVGLGNICEKAYMPVLGVNNNIALMLYNRSAEPLAEMQEKYRVEYGTNDLEELIADQPEGAFVLTASDSHYSIVKKLLENGIDVFVEKPATTHAYETKELAELADRKGRILMVAFNRRYAPLHTRAKELWGGKPVGLGIFRKFRSNPALPTISGQFYDDTIHQIDLLRYFCGEGKVESAVCHADGDNLISAAVVIRLESGGIGLIETNLQAGGWREYYSLYGGKQTVEIEAFSEVWITRGEEKSQWVEPYASAWQSTLVGRGFEGQISHFFKCMETREQPRTTAWDSVKTQALTEAIIEKLV